MSHPLDELEHLLDSDLASVGWRNLPRVAEWLCGASEQERIAANEAVLRRLADPQTSRYHESLHLSGAGTATNARQAVDALHGGGHGRPELLAEVLASREVSWLPEFVLLWIEETPWAARATVDLLVEAGLVSRPSSPAYIGAMISGLGLRPSPEQIRARLLTVPDTAGRDILHMLSTADVGHSLYMKDFYYRADDAEATWIRQIAKLVEEGVVDRTSVVDLCLATISRQEPERTELIWFVGMFEALKVNETDVRRHGPALVRLLRSDRSTVVALAQSCLLLLTRADTIDARAVIDASPAPLSRPEKKIVLAQLRILTQIATRHPNLSGTVVDQTYLALQHERTDVQAAALKLIAKFADEDSRASLDPDSLSPTLAAEAAAAGLAPTLADPADVTTNFADLEERIAQLSAAQRADLGVDAALATARVGAVPDLEPITASMGTSLPPPITDPVELVELFGELIERNGEPWQVQRVLAGAVRTAGLPLNRRATLMAPLLARAQSRALPRANPAGGYDTWSYVASVAYSWATGWQMTYQYLERDVTGRGGEWVESTGPQAPTRLSGIFAVQVAECTRMIANGVSGELLAEPTHDGGAVSPDILLQRLRVLPQDVSAGWPDIDIELAALHLPRSLDDEFWKLARKHQPDVASRLDAHHALQRQRAPQLEPAIGVPSGWFFHRRDQDQAIALAQCAAVASAPGAWSVLTDLHDILDRYQTIAGPFSFAEYDSRVAMWSMLAPWQHELISAHLLMPLARGQHSGTTAAPTAAALLDSPTGSFGNIAHLALAVALQGWAAETRTAAADVWLATATDGRLQPNLFADALDLLAQGGLLKLGRVIDTIRPTTHDPLVGYRTLQTLSAATPALLKAKARDMHRLIETMTELALRFGTESVPSQIAEVARRTRSPNALVTAARRLDGLTSAAPERGLAGVEVIQELLRRIDNSASNLR